MTTEQLRLRHPNAFACSEALARAETTFSTWGWFWRSRLLLWGVGCCAFLLLGTSGQEWGTDPTGLSTSFGRLGNVLAAPAVRWDSIWYLQIAHTGYRTGRDTAFFPLYPALIRIVGSAVRSYVAAGVLISCGSLLGALVIIRKLTEIELGSRAANATIALLAFTPMAVFFSAVYTESLFLLLSAGMFYAARRGRWGVAGSLGCLATLTHATGLLLIVPFLLLFFYGPRPEPPGAVARPWWRPRYEASPAILWVLLIPAGLAAYWGYLVLVGYAPGTLLHVEQTYWGRELVGPAAGVVAGIRATIDQLSGNPVPYSRQVLFDLSALLTAAATLRLTLKRLPVAYGAYAAVAILFDVSTTTLGTGLASFDRYAAVLFPLFMAAAAWAVERGCVRKLVLLSIVPLIFFTIQFATWRFVA